MRRTKPFEISYLKTGKSRSMLRPHYHKAYEILCLTSGEKTVTISGQSKTLLPGDLLIIAPYVEHITVCSAGFSRYLIYFSPDMLSGTFTKNEIMRFESMLSTRIIRVSDPERTEAYMRSIREKYRSESKTINKLAVWETVLMLYDAFAQRAGSFEFTLDGSEKPDADIIAALEYIEDHFTENLTHDRLCDTLHISKSTFYRRFTSRVGLPLKQYIIHKRIVRAVELLTEAPELKIAEIAARVGFSSASSMSKLIKDAYGKTPREMRGNVSG